MKWPKDRRKAFLWAAKAFGTPRAERTGRQKELTSTGFCYAIEELTDSDSIYEWASNFRYRCGMLGLFWWPIRDWRTWRTIHDKQRSLFCYLMAALSDKEFEELQA